jgi:hypothetical protein
MMESFGGKWFIGRPKNKLAVHKRKVSNFKTYALKGFNEMMRSIKFSKRGIWSIL